MKRTTEKSSHVAVMCVAFVLLLCTSCTVCQIERDSQDRVCGITNGEAAIGEDGRITHIKSHPLISINLGDAAAVAFKGD